MLEISRFLIIHLERILTQNIVMHLIVYCHNHLYIMTRKHHLLRHTSNVFKLSSKTLTNYSIRIQIIKNTNQTDYSTFFGRLPHSNMNLFEVVKGLVHFFLPRNTRPTSNQKDFIKFRSGFSDNEPLIKHFFGMP